MFNCYNDVIVLAAGRGERLKPLTDHVPKPLIKVGGQSLIEYHLHALAKAGCQRVIVNTAHLADLIKSHLGSGRQFGLEIIYSDEPPGALETGGAIKNALPLIKSEYIQVVNSDILTDYSHPNLSKPPNSWIHLVMVPNPKHNLKGDFEVNQAHLQHKDKEKTTYTYSGIGTFNRSLFEEIAEDRFPLLPIIQQGIDAQQATAEIHHGLWIDVGTAERLADAENIISSNAE